MSLPNLAQNEQQRNATVAKTPRRLWKWGVILLIAAVACVYAANYLNSGFERSVIKAGGTYTRSVGQYRPATSYSLIRHFAILIDGMLGNPRDSNVIGFTGGALQDEWLEQHATEISKLNMVSLALRDGATSIEGLRSLEGVQSIYHLDLSSSKLPDQALDSVVTMPNLIAVFLGGTGISDESLHTLSAHPKFQSISIDAGQATEAGLKNLAALPKLSHLTIDGVTDDTVERLDPAWKLTWLSLNNASLSVESISKLKQMTGISTLVLHCPDISAERLQMFRDELPNRQIYGRIGGD